MWKLLIFAVFVFADDLQHLQPGHRLDQQDIQIPISRICLRHGIEATAVESAVTHADHRLIAVDGLAVYLHHIMLRDSPDHINNGRHHIGPEAAEQRQALVVCHIGTDPGIQTHGADV